jgi:hypothetical protein
MPTTEKKAPPTIEENQKVFTNQFNTDKPFEYSQRMQGCWITILSNLNHTENGLITQADIQHLSEHFVRVGIFAENCLE